MKVTELPSPPSVDCLVGSLRVKLNDEYDMRAMAEEGVKAAREIKLPMMRRPP
jgi:hypothetical protein